MFGENLYTMKLDGGAKKLAARFDAIARPKKRSRTASLLGTAALGALILFGSIGCAYTEKAANGTDDEMPVAGSETNDETPASSDTDAADKVLRAFLTAWGEADYTAMKEYCTEEFVRAHFRNFEEERAEDGILTANLDDIVRIYDVRVGFAEENADGSLGYAVTANVRRPVYSSMFSGETSFHMTLAGQSDGGMKIDGIVFDAQEAPEETVTLQPLASDDITVHGGTLPGLDIAVAEGTVVSAAASGIVTACGYDPKLGNYVMITSFDGVASTYAALEKVYVKEGDKVNRGDALGTVGSTGLSTGPHLHYNSGNEDLIVGYASELLPDEMPASDGCPVLLAAPEGVSALKLLKVHTRADEDGKVLYDTTVLDEYGDLSGDEPILADLHFTGDLPEYALSFVGGDGAEKYYLLTIGGEDGSLLLTPFEPEMSAD